MKLMSEQSVMEGNVLESPGMSKPHLQTRVVRKGYDRKSCWVHARCGWLPPTGGGDRMVITLQKSHMGTEEGTWDVFSGLWMMRSDGGMAWTEPSEIPSLGEWREQSGVRVVICDFTPQWHAATGRILGIGHTARYREGKLLAPPRSRETAYSVYDAEGGIWGVAKTLDMGDANRFFCAGAGSTQWVELPNGEILLPIYFKDKVASSTPSSMVHALTKVMVLRCGFDGQTLSILQQGRELSTSARRGFGEPSLIQCRGKTWMTIRNGDHAYVAISHDGLNFSDPERWLFDDGSDLGSHDTQQHWARLGDRLFLVYTRRGLDNDHMVRHRAPLLMAEVDQERGCVLRETEQIVVPDRGAQLGNFGVTQGAGNEAWICVSEWMENAGEWDERIWNALGRKFPDADLKALAGMPGRCGLCELHGSDNSVYLVRVSLAQS